MQYVLPIIFAGLVYSITAVAYMHATFTSKDMFNLIYEEIVYIRKVVDEIKNRN